MPTNLYPRELRVVAELATTRPGRTVPDPPRGAGQTVVLVPGFLAPRRSLDRLGRWLASGGWTTVSAGIGPSAGCSQALVDRLAQNLEHTLDHGKRAVVIGQSRGGMLGRVLAVQRPELVHTAVSLGSPLGFTTLKPALRAQLGVAATIGSLGVPGLLTRDCLDGPCCDGFRLAVTAPPAEHVRLVSVWSHLDGVVDPASCHDPHAEPVQVRSSHRGMAVNAAVWTSLAHILERI